MENKLAIVIPYYKIDFFRETLMSLKNQTDQRFCVYIGDDASANDARHLVEELQLNNVDYERFEENLGATNLVAHWQRCISLIDTKVDWMMILGDDDYLAKNVVEEFYQNLDNIVNNASKVIKLNSIVIDEVGIEKDRKVPLPYLNNGIDVLLDKFQLQNRSSLSEHIFHLSTVKEVGIEEYPLAWHSDDMLILKLSLAAPLVYLNNAIAYIRVSSKSISGTQQNVRQKHKASLLFFKDVWSMKFFFTKQQLRRLIAVIEWQEKDKKAKIIEQNKFLLNLEIFGWKYAFVKLFK